MLSVDPGKETPPSCSPIEEQEERLPLAKPEQEGLVLTFVTFNHTINIVLLFQCFYFLISYVDFDRIFLVLFLKPQKVS